MPCAQTGRQQQRVFDLARTHFITQGLFALGKMVRLFAGFNLEVGQRTRTVAHRLRVFRGVKIFQSRAAFHLIVFEFRQLLVGVEGTLFGDATEHEILCAVRGKIQIPGFVEEDVEESLFGFVGHLIFTASLSKRMVIAKRELRQGR